MRASVRVLCVAAALLAQFSFVEAAHADDTPQASTSKQAVEQFTQASELYRQGRFAEAITLLRELQRTKPEPVLHYNLARAYEGLGKWHDAIVSYEAYLREDSTIVDRGAIERRLQTLRDAEARSTRAATAPSTAPAPQPEPRSYLLPAIVAGAGVMIVGTGFVLGGISRGEEAHVEDGRDQRASSDALGRAEDFATAANVAFVVGGILVAGGVVLLLLPKAKSSAFVARPAFRF
jgi:tetratricopeptide (TPR) repeat protein